jgi:hypothetical protein
MKNKEKNLNDFGIDKGFLIDDIIIKKPTEDSEEEEKEEEAGDE